MATLSEWEASCGDAFSAVRGLLEPAGALAETIPSALTNAPRLRVVRYRDGALAAVCDAGVSPRVELDAGAVTLHQVAWREARIAIAHALGVRTATTPITPLPGVLRLGAWEPQASTAFPVILVAHSKVADLSSLVREAILASDRAVLVATPTDDGWTDKPQSWAEARKCTLVPMHEALAANEAGEIVGSDAWPEFLTAFAARAGVSFPSATQNKRKRRRRGELVAKIEKLRTELLLEAESRVHLVKNAYDANQLPELPPLTKLALAERVGVKDYDVSRAFGDKAGADLPVLYALLEDPDGLLRWWANHRRLAPSCR
jgi:hypothetical protein